MMKNKKTTNLTSEQKKLVEDNTKMVNLACFELRRLIKGDNVLKNKLKKIGNKKLRLCVLNSDKIANFPPYALICIKYAMLKYMKEMQGAN